MADLVMAVQNVTASRQGNRVAVSISGESANSRDEVFTQVSQNGNTADIQVRVRPAEGYGTQMTGPFSTEVSMDGANEVKTVRVHAKNGVKTARVE